MATDNYVRSYGDLARKEDVVLNAVEILTAKETFIFNRLQKTSAIDTVHSYLTDTLKAAAANAQNEGDDYSYTARSTSGRLTNVVQNIHIPFAVSDTQRNIEHYHGRDELDRQTEKALMEFANDAEFNLVRSTLTSGASGTAPAMSKITMMCYTWTYAKIKSLSNLHARRHQKPQSKELLELLSKISSAAKNCIQKGKERWTESCQMERRHSIVLA